MKHKPKFQDPAMKPPKAMMQLVYAFTDMYKPVQREEYADEIFPVRRLRDYFQAWPVPKMPDPLPPYLNELEKRGYPMMTGYDGMPALFCVRWKVRGEVCTAEETTSEALIARRMLERRERDGGCDEEESCSEDDEDDSSW